MWKYNRTEPFHLELLCFQLGNFAGVEDSRFAAVLNRVGDKIWTRLRELFPECSHATFHHSPLHQRPEFVAHGPGRRPLLLPQLDPAQPVGRRAHARRVQVELLRLGLEENVRYSFISFQTYSLAVLR